MAWKPRIEFEGALYHVITRGNQRQPIFRGTEDYERYLRILGITKPDIRFTLQDSYLKEGSQFASEVERLHATLQQYSNKQA